MTWQDINKLTMQDVASKVIRNNKTIFFSNSD